MFPIDQAPTWLPATWPGRVRSLDRQRKKPMQRRNPAVSTHRTRTAVLPDRAPRPETRPPLRFSALPASHMHLFFGQIIKLICRVHTRPEHEIH